MKTNRAARAGTMESNYIYVMVHLNENGGIMIDLESVVIKQFKRVIKVGS